MMTYIEITDSESSLYVLGEADIAGKVVLFSVTSRGDLSVWFKSELNVTLAHYKPSLEHLSKAKSLEVYALERMVRLSNQLANKINKILSES